jgi:hypothetical protein
MAFVPGLSERIRAILGNRPGLSERRMFGGLAFLLNGYMFAGVQESTLMARAGPERHADALAVKRARDGLHRQAVEGLRLCRSRGH